jgi:hypothetical protein
VPAERGLCEFRNITIENVEVSGARRIFSASGLPEKVISNVRWENITAQGNEGGFIEYAQDWTMKNVRVETRDPTPVRLTNCNNVDTPEVVKEQ